MVSQSALFSRTALGRHRIYLSTYHVYASISGNSDNCVKSSEVDACKMWTSVTIHEYEGLGREKPTYYTHLGGRGGIRLLVMVGKQEVARGYGGVA